MTELEKASRALCLHAEPDCWETHLDDARRVISAIRNPSMNTVMRVARQTGLRPGHVDLAITHYLDAILKETP